MVRLNFLNMLHLCRYWLVVQPCKVVGSDFKEWSCCFSWQYLFAHIGSYHGVFIHCFKTYFSPYCPYRFQWPRVQAVMVIPVVQRSTAGHITIPLQSILRGLQWAQHPTTPQLPQHLRRASSSSRDSRSASQFGNLSKITSVLAYFSLYEGLVFYY